MKLEELPKSTSEVRKFSDGNTLLTLWFDGPKCRSMRLFLIYKPMKPFCFAATKSNILQYAKGGPLWL